MSTNLAGIHNPAHDSIPHLYPRSISEYLDNGKLGSSDVKSIDISGQTGEGFLRAIGSIICQSEYTLLDSVSLPDESIDLDGVNVIELLQSLLDLSLVGFDVNNKNEGVVFLDLLHGTLGVERVDDDLVLIETRLVRN